MKQKLLLPLLLLLASCFLACGKEPPKAAKQPAAPVKKEPYRGDNYKIGVILPLTGKYAVYGESTLHGIECAVGLFSPCEGIVHAELVVKDDAGTPERAVAAVEELAKNDKVSVIIGPLSSASIEAAAAKAQELSVPLISLSQREGISQIGDNIFSVATTASPQVDEIVGWATGTRKLKRFAVIYPKNNYGQLFKQLFTDAVAKAHGKIVMSEAYSEETLDFAGVFKRKELKEFDAVFIPDSYKVASYLVAAMAQEGIENVVFLGNNRWNNAGLVEMSGQAVDGAVFVDGFFDGGSSPVVKNFVSAFEQAYGINPTILEAQSYDAARLASKALQSTGGAHAKDVRDSLALTQGVEGSTGNVNFDANREARKNLFLLTVKNGKIREI